MAKWNNNEPSFNYVAHATLGVNLNRQKNAPLDVSSEYKSIKDALYYVTEGRYPANGEGVTQAVKDMVKYPYLGQVISIVDVDTEAVSLYYVKTAEYDETLATDDAMFEHYFEEVGRATIGDDGSITLDEETSTLSITGFGVEYYEYDKELNEGKGGYKSAPTKGWKAGLIPQVIADGENTKLAWFEPNPTTVEGLTDSITSLDTRLTTAENDIDKLEGRATTIEGNVSTLQTDLGTAQTDIDNLETRMNKAETDIEAVAKDLEDNYYDKTAVDGLVAGAFHFKGDADHLGEDGNLYSDETTIISNMKQGDVYQVGDKEYAYDGKSWVELGFTLDLSNYATKPEVTTAISNVKTELQGYADQAEADAITSANGYTDEKIEELKISEYAKTTDVTKAVDDAKTELQGYADQAETDAIATAGTNADTKISTAIATAKTEWEGYADQAEADAITTAGTNADTKISTAIGQLGDYATVKAYVDAKDSEIDAKTIANKGRLDNLDTVVAGKADAATTLAGYGITDAMTSTAITDAISTAKDEAISTSSSNADNKISAKVGDIGDKTVKSYVDDTITNINSTLDSKITQNTSNINKNADDIKAINDETTGILAQAKTYADGKVAKEDGKGLSTNDYTTAEKEKLAGIAQGAEVNVQANWNETDTTSDAFILNKPTSLSAFTNDSEFITKTVNDLTNYYKKTETYTQEEVNALIGDLATIQIEVVESLPSTGSSNIIYLVSKETADGEVNVYNEYIWVSSTSKFERVGDTSIDLSTYLTKTGDASKTTVAFTEATTRSAITTGENLDVIMGKLLKMYNDLQAVAFSGAYGDLTGAGDVIKVQVGTQSTATSTYTIPKGTVCNVQLFESVTNEVVLGDISVNGTTVSVTFTEAPTNSITVNIMYKEI